MKDEGGGMKDKKGWTEARVFGQLRHIFPSPAYARLPQVRNGTGYSRSKTRTADAIVLSTWPSRGLWMAGIEIKVSVADWKRELANPAKASSIQAYCHHWYAACPRGLIDLATVPETWGLIEVNGTTAEISIAAPRLDAKPIDMALLCSILRTVEEVTTPTDLVEDKISERVKQALDGEAKRREYESDALRKSVEEFEKAAGIKIASRWEAGSIGEAVAFVRKVGIQHAAEQAKRLERECNRAAEIFRSAVADLETGIVTEEKD